MLSMRQLFWWNKNKIHFNDTYVVARKCHTFIQIFYFPTSERFFVNVPFFSKKNGCYRRSFNSNCQQSKRNACYHKILCNYFYSFPFSIGCDHLFWWNFSLEYMCERSNVLFLNCFILSVSIWLKCLSSWAIYRIRFTAVCRKSSFTFNLSDLIK